MCLIGNTGLLCMQCRGIEPHLLGNRDVSWDFLVCGRNMGYILELQRGWTFETPLCSAKSGLLSSVMDTSGI